MSCLNDLQGITRERDQRATNNGIRDRGKEVAAIETNR